MIIDSHLHQGTRGIFDLPCELVLEQMDRYGIDRGIVSSVECAEYQPDRDEVFPEPDTQLQTNHRLLELVKSSGGRLVQSFWCKPATESAQGVLEFCRENREYVRGLKFHPFYSRLPLEDTRYRPYLEIARILSLPVSVHTAPDNRSTPRQLLRLAREYPQVQFIMVHMELGTDHEDAINCVSRADNLYGDTTWVTADKVNRAMQICGSEKILFGSDAPIDADHNYPFYSQLLSSYRREPDGSWADVMYRNAQRLFGL